MKLKYEQARRMRKALTPPEYILWQRIKTHETGGPVFRRQYAFGPYILDFYCIKAKLAIEVDGNIHGTSANTERDNKRDMWLQSQGVYVYRIPAAEVFRHIDIVADGVYDLAIERLTAK